MNLEDLQFLVTNGIPRAAVTRFFGWFSKIENPLVCRLSLAVWRLFTEVNLDEAKQAQFKSLHECFIRELKDGARPIDADPAILSSPCDAIVGAAGQVEGDQLIQAKGLTYTLLDLLGDPELVDTYRDGRYVTLRLSSSMYHRFHAPADCRVERLTYVSGDTWNTHPTTVARVERLFARNERAIVRTRLDDGGALLTLVPVASILVASLRFHFVDVLFHLKYRGPHVIPCDAPFRKGQEMGWFEMGSTIIVFAPKGFSLCEGIELGKTIRMGQPLLSRERRT
jgi:phosphatidylserine decarboxylase